MDREGRADPADSREVIILAQAAVLEAKVFRVVQVVVNLLMNVWRIAKKTWMNVGVLALRRAVVRVVGFQVIPEVQEDFQEVRVTEENSMTDFPNVALLMERLRYMFAGEII